MADEKYSITIKELPEDERPRERLLKYGADALSNAELLAIILRVGTPEYSAIGLAQHMLGRATAGRYGRFRRSSTKRTA